MEGWKKDGILALPEAPRCTTCRGTVQEKNCPPTRQQEQFLYLFIIKLWALFAESQSRTALLLELFRRFRVGTINQRSPDTRKLWSSPRAANHISRMTTLSILHWNDVYRVGAQKVSPNAPETTDVTQFGALLDDIRNQWTTRPDGSKDGLVLFSGDVFSPSVESSVTRGSHMVQPSSLDHKLVGRS